MVPVIHFKAPLPKITNVLFGKEFNIIVKNEFVVGDESDLFFNGQECFTVEPDMDMFDILVRLGLFSSKGQARNNWKLSGKDIPEGFSDFINIGKSKTRITILNPTIHNKE